MLADKDSVENPTFELSSLPAPSNTPHPCIARERSRGRASKGHRATGRSCSSTSNALKRIRSCYRVSGFVEFKRRHRPRNFSRSRIRAWRSPSRSKLMTSWRRRENSASLLGGLGRASPAQGGWRWPAWCLPAASACGDQLRLDFAAEQTRWPNPAWVKKHVSIRLNVLD